MKDRISSIFYSIGTTEAEAWGNLFDQVGPGELAEHLLFAPLVAGSIKESNQVYLIGLANDLYKLALSPHQQGGEHFLFTLKDQGTLYNLYQSIPIWIDQVKEKLVNIDQSDTIWSLREVGKVLLQYDDIF